MFGAVAFAAPSTDYFALWTTAAATDMDAVRRVLGHSDLSTTAAIYGHHDLTAQMVRSVGYTVRDPGTRLIIVDNGLGRAEPGS